MGAYMLSTAVLSIISLIIVYKKIILTDLYQTFVQRTFYLTPLEIAITFSQYFKVEKTFSSLVSL